MWWNLSLRVYVENCEVYDCYIGSTNTSNHPGIIVGKVDTAFINISGCIVHGNEVLNTKNAARVSIVGTASKSANSTTLNRLSNSIIIDAMPYSANGDWWFKALDHKIFQNVYFDQTGKTGDFGNWGHSNSKITQLASSDDAKGIAAITNMPDLDWEGTWIYGLNDEYPSIVPSTKVNNQNEKRGHN